MMFWLVSAACILLLFYKYIKRNNDFWKKKNVVYHPPVPFFGNLKESIFMTKSLGQIYSEIYNAYKDVPYVGIYIMREPALLIRDPAIIKDIQVKEFHKFEKNAMLIDEKVDPIAGKNPFFQYGQRWKVTRSQLGNCFSSGKMKLMTPLLYGVSKNMTTYLERLCKVGKNTAINTKEFAGKFTTDAVATCAFGLDAGAFENPDGEFIQMGQQVLQPSFALNVKLLIMMLFPSCSKIFSIKFIPDNVAHYFKSIIRNTLQYRKDNNIVRNDFLDIINQLKFTPGEFSFGDEDITSHAVSFFGDGFETSSIVLSFTLYELAANPTVQQKLKDEIEEVLKKHGGVLTYEAIQDMNYLDCILSESLRMHPPGLFLSKICTEDYTLPPCTTGSQEYTLKEGMVVVIPLYALHQDPKHFPNPNKFDPGRFSQSNKSEIDKGAYLPFGNGPRVCIGMRFAVLQIKVAIVAIIKDFEIRVNKKTKEPLEIDPTYFMLLAKGGLWLDYYKRN